MNIDEVMAALDEAGWFEGRSEDHRAAKRAELEKLEVVDAEGIATALADFVFDTECIDGNEGDYAGIVALYAEAAKHVFVIEDIEDRFVVDEDTGVGAAAVRFRVGDTPYQVSVPFESDWFDEAVANLVNTAAEAHGQGWRFELLPVLDQAAYVVFVKPAALKAAFERGLFAKFEDLMAEQLS